MNFRVDHPELLWLLLLIGPIAWLGWTRLTTVEPWRRGLALGLRCAVLTLLVLMLAGLRAERRHTDLTVIAVIDQSPSMRVFGDPRTIQGNSDPKPTLSQRGPDDPASPTPPPRTLTQSIADYLLAASERDRQPDDRFGVVTYDDRPTVRKRPGSDVSFDAAIDTQTREGTDTARALEWAMAAKSDANTALRLVLVSDGNDTTGDTLAAARAAAASGVVIDVLPIDYRVGEEVMVEGVYTPVEAREGQTIAVRVVLRGTAPMPGTLQLEHDGRLLDLNGGADGKGLPVTPDDWSDSRVSADNAQTPEAPEAPEVREAQDAAGRYVLAKQIDVPIALAGPNRFAATFEPAPGSNTSPFARGLAQERREGEGHSDPTPPLSDALGAKRLVPTLNGASGGDTVALNNRAESFTLVQGQGRVLLVDNVGGDSGLVLPQALSERQINVDVVRPPGFPQDMLELSRYDAVLFQNVPADAITGQQQTLLARYVNDLGGGFVMIGGPDSFGAGGWTNSIIDKSILPVACEIPSQTVMPSGALVIVIDRSGSMSAPVGQSGRNQQEIANEAAALAIQTLYPHDLIGVVAFDDFATEVVPLQPNRDPQGIMRTVRSIQPAGGTSIYAGLERAHQMLTQNSQQLRESSLKHIILLSDGQSAGNYLPLVNQLQRANITLSTIGVGDGHDGQLLESLALVGGGEYHPVTDPADLPQVFIKEARTIRKNLIKEVTFTPRRVNTASPVMVNLPATPPLNGFVLTGPKYDRRIEMPLLGPEGEPLFAHWQVGLGKAAAFTSDATNRWATQWLSWNGYGDFWARTVRHVGRPPASREAELVATIDGDQLKVRLDIPPHADAEPSLRGEASGNSANTFGGQLSIAGKILNPDGSIADITLQQTGPGLYEATAPAPATGSYLLNLFMRDASGDSGGEPRFVSGGATRVPGEELRRFAPDKALLREVAAITGGRVLDPANPDAAALFDRSHRFESVSTLPLRWLLLPWLLGLLIADVANRRIAWDHRAIARWTRQKLTVHRRSSAETTQTMGALKRRRGEAVATHGTIKPASTPAPPGLVASATSAPPRTPHRKARFEARPGTRVSDDFATALGSAKANADVSKLKPTRDEPMNNDEPAGTTNRLLAAKRRAREKLDD